MRFSLRVKPRNLAPFEAQADKLVSRLELPRLQPGATIHVKYLPNSREVTIVEEPSTSP